MDNLNYGVIGNGTSAALISNKGSIDWCSLPEFDSSSIFAKLLDKKKGGHFGFIVEPEYHIKQRYVRNTNILLTDFINDKDHFQVLDFMPRYKNDQDYHTPPDIIRYLKHISGKPKFRIDYNPQLEYAAIPTKTEILKNYIKSYTTNGIYDSLYLYTNLDRHAVISQDIIELDDDAFLLVS